MDFNSFWLFTDQDWLTRRREDEWGFGQQKLVQASVQQKGLSSAILQAAYRAIFVGLVWDPWLTTQQAVQLAAPVLNC